MHAHEDRRRPTEPGTQHTGWIAYYICDRSGSGFFRPTYINVGMEDGTVAVDDEALLSSYNDNILCNHETWALHSQHSLVIHTGVVPPPWVAATGVKDAQRLLENARARVRSYEHLLQDVHHRPKDFIRVGMEIHLNPAYLKSGQPPFWIVTELRDDSFVARALYSRNNDETIIVPYADAEHAIAV